VSEMRPLATLPPARPGLRFTESFLFFNKLGSPRPKIALILDGTTGGLGQGGMVRARLDQEVGNLEPAKKRR
jgi:hypothetical protein